MFILPSTIKLFGWRMAHCFSSQDSRRIVKSDFIEVTYGVLCEFFGWHILPDCIFKRDRKYGNLFNQYLYKFVVWVGRRCIPVTNPDWNTKSKHGSTTTEIGEIFYDFPGHCGLLSGCRLKVTSQRQVSIFPTIQIYTTNVFGGAFGWVVALIANLFKGAL